LGLSHNNLTGAIPKAILALTPDDSGGIDMSHNLLTGDATPFVASFGIQPLQYNCFDPAVPPSNPSC
jgi:hypothetical protein